MVMAKAGKVLPLPSPGLDTARPYSDITPRPKAKLDPEWGEYWSDFTSGSGTNSLTFAYTVSMGNRDLKPELSAARSVAVLANSLGPSGGAIRYVSSGDPAYLVHTGLDHDANHQVDWRR